MIEFIFLTILKYSFIIEIVIVSLLSFLVIYQIYIDYERINEINKLQKDNINLNEEIMFLKSKNKNLQYFENYYFGNLFLG